MLRRVDAGVSPECLGLPAKQMNGKTGIQLCPLQGLTSTHSVKQPGSVLRAGQSGRTGRHTHTLSSLPSLPEALSQVQRHSHAMSGDCRTVQTWTVSVRKVCQDTPGSLLHWLLGEIPTFGSHTADQGRAASAVRKLREMNAGPQLTFSFVSGSENCFL